MNGVLTTTLIVLSLVVALWGVVLVAIGKPVQAGTWQGLVALGLALLLELGLLGQAVGGFVAMAVTDRELDGLSFGGYLVGCLVVPPLAAVWSLAERTRWGPGVLVIAGLAVPVMIVRLGQIWEAHV